MSVLKLVINQLITQLFLTDNNKLFNIRNDLQSLREQMIIHIILLKNQIFIKLQQKGFQFKMLLKGLF